MMKQTSKRAGFHEEGGDRPVAVHASLNRVRSERADDGGASGHRVVKRRVRRSLRIIRLGDNFFTLYRVEGGTWTRGRTFPRPDLPDTLQLGIAAYSNGAYFGSDIDSKTFNTIPENGPADLLVRGDYIRFARPNVPAELAKQLADGSAADSA